MTEREFLAVQSLTRLRAAMFLLGDANPPLVQADLKPRFAAAVGAIDDMIEELEDIVSDTTDGLEDAE